MAYILALLHSERPKLSTILACLECKKGAALMSSDFHISQHCVLCSMDVSKLIMEKGEFMHISCTVIWPCSINSLSALLAIGLSRMQDL